MIEPKMLTQSVKALSDQRDQVGNDMQKAGMTVQKKHPAARQGAF